MAEVLVALEAYAVVEQVSTIYASARDRIEKAYRNPQQAKRLAGLFDRLVTQLAPLAEQCWDNDVKFADQHLDVFKLRIEELKATMETKRTKLEQKIAKLNNPLYRFTRAIATSDWLAELENNVRDADQLVLHITTCFANATLTDKLTNTVGALHVGAEEQDAFRPSVEVPDNPPHVVLNFGSISNMDGDAASPPTVEAKLKRAVLRSDGSTSIGAVGSIVAGGVGVRGMSGVGKSCALRGLAKDEEVTRQFRDGIYFMILGQDAAEADVVDKVAKIMNTSGSNRLARKARESKSIDDAVSKAKLWFRERCLLLLIDDVWEENDSRRDIVTRLSRIADTDSGSRVVFSTRDVRMTARSETICFSARDDDNARWILLAAAGLGHTDAEQSEAGVDEVLRCCGGIPMALAVAGSAIKMRLLSVDTSSTADVWEEYVSGLRRCRQRLVKLTVDNDSYTNLEAAFRTSLETLEKNKSRKLAFPCELSFPKMYRALVVLRRQGWVPVDILVGLWECADLSEAMDVMQELVGASLAQREDRTVAGRKVSGITLHDLQLDFVLGECEEYGEVEMWHRKSLRSRMPEEGSSSNETFAACRNWAKDDVFTDEYIRNNLSRHLMAAGLGAELKSLLMNPEWAAQRLRAHEILSLEKDFGMMLEHLRKRDGRDSERGGEMWSLRMIAGAARLSAPYVSRNASEVWFQLHARLFRHAKESGSEIIRAYVAEIERCADRPWVKALTPCLPEPGGVLQGTMFCSGRVSWISEWDGSERTVVCGVDAGSAFVSTFVRGQIESTVWLSISSDDADGFEEGTPTGQGCNSLSNGGCSAEDRASDDSGSVSSSSESCGILTVCCTSDGTRAGTGHQDGTVQIWNAKTGEAIGEAMRGHDSRVWCVAWSPNGRRVASGAGDGSVRVWDVEKGEAIGEALRGHSGWVRCVAWSRDGRHLASGGIDGTVRMWDVEKRETIGEALHGHGSWLRCVVWSPDGRRVASGAGDGSVRVWDVEKGEAIGEALRGHSGWVQCVTWSRDGRRVASGEDDGTVFVWDVENGEAVEEAMSRHGQEVLCVAWSPDGRRVACGAADGTVSVWDVEQGEQIGEALLGMTTWFYALRGRLMVGV